MSTKKDLIRNLEIAIDMLDRVEGTTIYNIQRDCSNWSDKEYSQMLQFMALFLFQLQSQDEE